MNLDKYTQLLIGRSNSTEIPAHEFRLRHIPNIDFDKLLCPHPQIRLDSIKKILVSNTYLEIALFLRLLSIEINFKIRFYTRKALNSMKATYPFWR